MKPESSRRRPNILLILNDDMGFSDIGCYGGEIRTPALDRLAKNGLRFTQFYNTARCSPSRASLLTGLHPHQTGIGILTYDTGPDGYPGNLNDRCVTIAEALKPSGYRNYMIGKWHIASSLKEPTDAWPIQRGFDRFYGTITGAGGFYDPNTLTRGNENIEHEAREEGFFYTDAISDRAVEFIREHARDHPESPFFQYVAYAAQVDRMDRGIARIVAALEETGQLENTLIVFLSDNGACAEDIPADELVSKLTIARTHTRDGREVRFGNRPDIMPGPEDTYQSYGTAWANLSNTPFRLYKHWVHEGGIATPFIVHWPAGIEARDELRHAPAQLPDVMATVLDVAGAAYSKTYEGREILPLEGMSLKPVFAADHLDRGPLFWEHEGNAAVRIGKWKVVKEYPKPWELYDMETDRTEMNNLADEHPEQVRQMIEEYRKWAHRCSVKPREAILDYMSTQGKAFWER